MQAPHQEEAVVVAEVPVASNLRPSSQNLGAATSSRRPGMLDAWAERGCKWRGPSAGCC